MVLSKNSLNKLKSSMMSSDSSADYAGPIYNYLVYGFHPGSFFRALLANDFMSAIAHSHPANSVYELKKLVGWLCNSFPPDVVYGNYEVVESWCRKTDEERYQVLLDAKLVYDKETEMMLILQGKLQADAREIELV
jgi:hypothetical protein